MVQYPNVTMAMLHVVQYPNVTMAMLHVRIRSEGRKIVTSNINTGIYKLNQLHVAIETSESQIVCTSTQ